MSNQQDAADVVGEVKKFGYSGDALCDNQENTLQ